MALACAGLMLLSASLSRADDVKPPVRGLVSMGAYRFVGAGGDVPRTVACTSVTVRCGPSTRTVIR